MFGITNMPLIFLYFKQNRQAFGSEKELDISTINQQLEKLIYALVTSMGNVVSERSRLDIEELITFDKNVAEVYIFSFYYPEKKSK